MKKTKPTKPARFPAIWNISLIFLLLIALLLISFNFRIPLLISLTNLVQEDKWPRFLGIYILSIVIGHWIVSYLIEFVDKRIGLEGERSIEDLWSAAFLGISEGIMYPAALIANQPDFIGLWLAIKVAGQWVAWRGEDRPSNSLGEEAKKGRRRFNRFLIGNAIRIILAGLTFLIFRATVLNTVAQ